MKIKIYVLLLTLVTIACSTDDTGSFDNDVNTDSGLTLKRIYSEEIGIISNFDENGRLLYSEIERFDRVIKLSEFIYSGSNKKKVLRYNDFGWVVFEIEYFYNDQDMPTKIVNTNLGSLGEELVTTSTITYMGNDISSIIANENGELFEMIFQFNSSSYERIEKYEVFSLKNQEKIFEETYEYSSEGDFLANTILLGESEVDCSRSFKYDDKINPLYEIKKPGYLTDLLDGISPGSLNVILAGSSKHNITSAFMKGNSRTYEYNNQDYPIKEVELNADGNVLNTRLFEYY